MNDDDTRLNTEAEQTLTDIEQGVSNPPMNQKELTENDSRLLTQASLSVVLGVTAEVIDGLSGNGLSLALEDGTIPSRGDVRRLVAKTVYNTANKKAAKFEHSFEGDV